MDIKCNFNSIYIDKGLALGRTSLPAFCGKKDILLREVGVGVDEFVRRPVAKSAATGLRGFRDNIKKSFNYIKALKKEYVQNIKHTYDHKIIFAMVEKELYGRNSIDSITHDLDKFILYSLGFNKPFVSKYHRLHSEHHWESGKKLNLKSMLCDNIASSPEFKPEKPFSLRDYYNNTKELQHIEGFGDILETYNYGENIDFEKLKFKKNNKYKGAKGTFSCLIKVLPILLTGII